MLGIADIQPVVIQIKKKALRSSNYQTGHRLCTQNCYCRAQYGIAGNGETVRGRATPRAAHRKRKDSPRITIRDIFFL
jgi:hypothetical protein